MTSGTSTTISTLMPLNLSPTPMRTESSRLNFTIKTQTSSALKTTTFKTNPVLLTAPKGSTTKTMTAMNMPSFVTTQSTPVQTTPATLAPLMTPDRSSATTETMTAMKIPSTLTTQSAPVQTTPATLAPLMTPDHSNATKTSENFFEMNKWAFISVFILVGLVTILLIPGALCGYIKIAQTYL